MLSWRFIVSAFSSTLSSLHAKAYVISVVILEQLGFCFVFILQLNVVRTTAANRQRRWGGSLSLLIQMLPTGLRAIGASGEIVQNKDIEAQSLVTARDLLLVPPMDE